MKSLFLIIPSLFTITINIHAQEITQTISGKVIASETEEPLPFVNIYIKDSDPLLGTTSNEEGYYQLENVPLGRVTIEASYLGFETILIPEIIVTSAKAVQLNITLIPSLSSLNEVIITPKINKQKPINTLASVSARMVSVEEASRYAGGFDDPARLVSSFAGVASGNGGDNAIVIRGNAPKFLQWKIEGVEIPNPNHFANLSSFGGGGLTALSSNVLANSDFLTGAFPAEYNNAIAGVFDIRMRTGNTNNFEHSIETGIIGIDLASEGPINTTTNASYVANYRYSTLALIPSLLPDDANGIKYQDLSFKIQVPTKKWGTMSFWGIGLIDQSGTSPKTEASERVYYQDVEKQDVSQYMGSIGVNHRFHFKNAAYINSTLAYTIEGLNLKTERLNQENTLVPENKVENTLHNFTLKSVYNKRFSQRFSNRSGFTFRSLGYNLKSNQQNQPNVTQDNGASALISAFTNITIRNEKIKYILGVSSQLFTLNNQYTIEPRIGFSYQLNNKNNINFGYGLHSRLEPIQIYFTKTNSINNQNSNKELDFTKAHHLVLGYHWDITKNTLLKIEPYYQILYNAPIVNNSNESLLNVQSDWFLTNAYVNAGKGQNYGIDLTLEQYMQDGFYYLISGSLFNSQYKTDTSQWFSTRFNKNYLIHALVGKEFTLGKSKQNTLGVNLKVSIQGGDRFSKIDEKASALQEEVVYNQTNPFTEQTRPSTVIHTTINYTWNRIKTSHKVSLKVLNINNFKGFQGHRYNIQTTKVDEYYEALMIPNLSYKISF